MVQDPKRLYKLAGLLGLLVVGLVLLALPTTTEESLQQYSAQVTKSEFDASIGYAPPGYSADAHITVGNQVAVRVTLVETNAVLFTASFPAGTFDIPTIIVFNGGNIFLTIEPQNGVFTQMNVFARIFHDVITYRYAWLGLGVLSMAGLYGLATFLPNTAFGRLAGRIIPVHRV